MVEEGKVEDVVGRKREGGRWAEEIYGGDDSKLSSYRAKAVIGQ